MVGLGFQRKRRSPPEILSASLVSLSLFLVSQFSLAMVPRFLPWLSLVGMLPVSGCLIVGSDFFISFVGSCMFIITPRFFAAFVLLVTIGLGRFSRRALGVSQSAPAMVVFHLLFVWGVYISMIREGTSSSLFFSRYFS